MTDFDPDAYLAQKDDGAATAFDPDAYLSQPQSAPTPRTPPTAKQHASDALSIATKHPFTAPLGLLENAASGVTGGIGSLADAVTGADPGTHDWAYRPRTEAGKEIAAVGADEAAAIGRGYDATAGTGPLAQTLKERIPEAVGAVGTVAGLGEIPKFRGATPSVPGAPPTTAQSVLDASVANSPQSMGAAAAAPRMTNVSPELQQAVVRTAQQTGGVVNPEILNRHIEADSLPVKIQLTPGQAMQDPTILSREMNNRGRTPGLPDLLHNQNRQLAENVQAIRDEVGPDVFSTNQVEHADTLIKTYKDKASEADTQTTADYKALKDANGGDFPVDAPTLLDNATRALHQELLFDHAPKAVMSTLGRLADSGRMTFENFESLRTNLARIQRSKTADGNEIAAAGVIRNAMEELPLAPGAASLKPLADTARASAKAQFDALKADPAYDAAVNDKVPPDRFVQKFIVGAPRDQVAIMRENLGHDPVAVQTMGVAALDHLRQAAGIDAQGNGNFSQAGFNKNYQALSPKMRSLVDPKTAETLDTLGNVARYTQAQPRGSFVNNSNTLVGALAEHGATAAENILNAKTGIGGTVVRKVLQKRAENKIAKETMTPYGGLGRLKDVGK